MAAAAPTSVVAIIRLSAAIWAITLLIGLLRAAVGGGQALSIAAAQSPECSADVYSSVLLYSRHLSQPAAFRAFESGRAFELPHANRCLIAGGKGGRCGAALRRLEAVDLLVLANNHVPPGIARPANLTVLRVGSPTLGFFQPWGETALTPEVSLASAARCAASATCHPVPTVPARAVFLSRRWLPPPGAPVGLFSRDKFVTALPTGTFSLLMLLERCERITLCGFCDEDDLLREGSEALAPTQRDHHGAPCRFCVRISVHNDRRRFHWFAHGGAQITPLHPPTPFHHAAGQHHWMEDIVLRRSIMACFPHVTLTKGQSL
jgi:hypothetical protein